MSKIIVFGENLNDSKAIKELVLHLCPSLSDGDVVVLREPPTLQRGTAASTVRAWSERAIAAMEASKAVRGSPVCVLVHTDSDGPGGTAFAAQRTTELQQGGLREAHAVVPAESIESWWLLHPSATEAVVPSWRGALKPNPGDVDRISGPKAELVRRTRRKQPKREYQEADSPDIAATIRASKAKPAGVSPSWEAFVGIVAGCCAKASAA